MGDTVAAVSGRGHRAEQCVALYSEAVSCAVRFRVCRLVEPAVAALQLTARPSFSSAPTSYRQREHGNGERRRRAGDLARAARRCKRG